MRFPKKVENNGWKTRFALFPVRIGEEIVWLELYAERNIGGLYDEVREYEGCAERVGYPCDCYRH